MKPDKWLQPHCAVEMGSLFPLTTSSGGPRADHGRKQVAGGGGNGGLTRSGPLRKPLVAVVTKGDGPLTLGRPHPPDDRLQANAGLVRGPDLDRRVRVLGPRLGDGLLQLFLNASRASGVAAAGWRGRGFCTDPLIALSASQPRWGNTAASPSSPAIQAATFGLVHKPPSGGGSRRRALSFSSRSGLRTEGLVPFRRRRSPRACGPWAL